MSEEWNLRALPRAFVPFVDPEGRFEVPKTELNKFRKVLRLSTGDRVALLPNDGSLWVCRLDGHAAIAEMQTFPNTEASTRVRIAQALPKGDKIDEIVRACTELGADEFVFFPSERSVVRWDEVKLAAKVRRLETIAQEACEVAFRTRLPKLLVLPSLDAVLNEFPDCLVLSESEAVVDRLETKAGDQVTLVVGPEGGWAPRESAKFEGRARSLGPRVLRVEHAAAAAVAYLLIGPDELRNNSA